jgi:DNA-directed RNA polymerase specialized sigma24 family protein
MRDEQRQAFERFSTARAGALLTDAHLLTGDPAVAGDLVRAALARTYRRWRRVGPDGAEEYAHRLIVAGAMSARGRRRSSGRHPRVAAVPPVTAPDASGAAHGGSGGAAGTGGPGGDADVVWRALSGLPARRRAVLVLRYHDGRTDAEIGRLLWVSAETVQREAAEGLAALGRILRRRGRPEDLLPAALDDPARRLPPPADAADDARERVRRSRRRRLGVAAVALAAVGGTVAAVALPSGADPAAAPSGPLPAATPAAGVGLLEWPARGPLVGDTALLRRALRSWQDSVPPAERPERAVSVLYAGEVDGARTVLLQGLDPAGLPRVAQVSAPGGDAEPRLARAERLAPAGPVLAVQPAGDSGGGPRLLAPPKAGQGLVGGGILVRETPQPRPTELRRLTVGADGLTEPLAALDGAQPAYVVAVRGRPVDDPRALPRVLGSGRISAGRLTPGPALVQAADPTLRFGRTGSPSHGWYADAHLLAERFGGPVRVAAVSEPVVTAVASGRARGRTLYSAGYEVVRGGTRWLAYLVWLDDEPLCVQTTRLGPATGPARLPFAVRRCMSRRYGAGLVHVFAGPGVASVQLSLGAARRGERPYRTSFSTASATGPDAAGAPPGHSRSLAIPVGYPTGRAAAVALNGARRRIARIELGPYG